jgi:hypothetical protein
MGGARSKHGSYTKYIRNFTLKARREENLEDLGVDGMILEWILATQDDKVWTGCVQLRIGTSGGIF